MIILADIGGTYARFGLAEEGKLKYDADTIKKYEVSAFPTFMDALKAYLDHQSCDSTKIMIATAAYSETNSIWRFTNNNPWIIDLKDIQAQGFQIELILNDFEAATWALPFLKDSDAKQLSPSQDDHDIDDVAAEQYSRCLAGPGTGLGLGFLHPDMSGNWSVNKTHGGHMPAVAMNDEQWQIIQTVKAQNDYDVIVFEYLISGFGLLNIARAVCALENSDERFELPADVLNSQSLQAQRTLRLFHEFFGLFCTNAVITGHAYGGLYLMGGVLDHIVRADKFDWPIFESYVFSAPKASEQVFNAITQIPIFYVEETHLAFRGLLACQKLTSP